MLRHPLPQRVGTALLILAFAAGCAEAPTSSLPDAQFARNAAALAPDDFEYTVIRHPNAPTRTWVRGMNTRGDIVGDIIVGGPSIAAGGVSIGFLLLDGTFHAVAFDGAVHTFVNGINDRGDIVGVYNAGSGPRAFILSGGAYSTLPAPAGYATRAYDIASNGVIAGSYNTGTGNWRPAIWERGVFTPLDGILAELGADMAEGFGINARGQVVGHFTVAGDIFPGTLNQKMYGFVYDRGRISATLNFPGSGWMSCAFAISAQGEAVGHYVDIATEAVAVSGYMWRNGEYVARLGVPGAVGTYPESITPNGAIAGNALLGARTPAGAYLWTDAVGFVAMQKRPGRR
jgi:uncharacterized membrane protein